jgi:hypothetical protein
MNRQDTARLASDAGAVSNSNGEHAPSASAKIEIDAAAISALISFFKLLDKWDREARGQ